MKNNDIFIVVPWPEVQELMEYEDFDKNTHLINDLALYNEYGDSAYFVRKSWIDNIK